MRRPMATEATGSSLQRLGEAAWERLGGESRLFFEDQAFTGQQLAERTRRLSQGFRDAGLQPGERVVVCMANCPEVLETYRALWRIGAIVTPLLFLLSSDELRAALSDSGAVAVVTTPEFLPKIASASSGLDVRCVITGPAVEGTVSFSELAAGPEAPLVSVDPSSIAALLYTGGTTGRAKGVMLSHDALSTAAWSATLAGIESQHAVSLTPLPLAHVYGLMVSVMSLHAVHPSRSVLMRWFDAQAWLSLAQKERVEISALVPTMLRLLAAQPLESYDLSALRRLVSGSAPLPAEVRDDWARRVPHVELVEGYGCSETAASATASPPGRARAGSVGLAAPGVAIRIVRPDGSSAATGEDGEICIRSQSLMTGYWHDPSGTAQAIRDGWFHTGDIGHLDADGYLFIVDRLKDVIIRGGFNVYPRDVEEALLRHPAVALCAVVGRPDPDRGEEVVAYVQLHPGSVVKPDELVAFARVHLSAVKYPREVHVIDALPLTSVGKLDRKALRAML